jgi:hypothetical protein
MKARTHAMGWRSLLAVGWSVEERYKRREDMRRKGTCQRDNQIGLVESTTHKAGTRRSSL